jgi:hypothetical protein
LNTEEVMNIDSELPVVIKGIINVAAMNYVY